MQILLGIVGLAVLIGVAAVILQLQSWLDRGIDAAVGGAARRVRGAGSAQPTMSGLSFPAPFAIVRPAVPSTNPLAIRYSGHPSYRPEPLDGEQVFLRLAGAGDALMAVGEDGGPVRSGTGRPTRVVHGTMQLMITDRKLAAVFNSGESILGRFDGGGGLVLALVEDLDHLTSLSFEMQAHGPLMTFDDIDHFCFVRLTSLVGASVNDGPWASSIPLARLLPIAAAAVARARLGSAEAVDRPALERALAGEVETVHGGIQTVTLKGERVQEAT